MRLSQLFLVFGIIFFTNCTSEKRNTSSLIDFIPRNSPVVLKILDFDTFKSEISENKILVELQNSGGITKITEKLKPLTYVSSQKAGLIAILNNSENSFDFVYVPSDSLPQIVLDSTTDKTVESIEKNNLKFRKYEIEGNTFYTSSIQNKEIVSSSLLALEEVWTDIENGTIVKNQFRKFNELENLSKSAQIWVDVNNSKGLFQNIFGIDSVVRQSYADWISLDITLNDDELLLNGISILNDSLKNYLGLFSNTKPLINQTKEFTPINADSYISYTFNNYKTFSKKQESFLDTIGNKDSIFSAVEEIGIADIDTEKIVLLKTYGTANISDYLKGIQINSIEFQGSEIMEVNGDSALQQSFYPIIKDFEPRFSTIIGNIFAFSSKQETIENFISSSKSEQSIEKALIFENIQELITSESTILSISNSKGLENNLEQTGIGGLNNVLNKADLKDYLFGSQIIADAGFMHTNYFIKKITESNIKTGTSEMFKLQLDSDISLNPQFFTNHRTNRKDIVVQDKNNVLYLISYKGKIIWKKELESAIQGKIHEVDIYRNGKYQLAFTTNNRFYIVDRNGKEVAPFTYKFDGGNLNPLAVFDYSGNKNYRFVVTQGDKVYMYNNDGKIVSGFKYTKAEENILGAPQHFAIGTRDYLVFKLSDGSLKILNRVGNVRVRVSEKISFSENEVKVHQNKFIVTSKDGILYEINTQGKVETTDLQINADHGMDATSRTLVSMNDNILSIRGKKVALDLGVYTKPSIFYLNDKIYVSVTDIQNLKSYLYDSQAEPIAGFPVYGASTIDMADMDNDNKPELVLKDQENSLVVYKVH